MSTYAEPGRNPLDWSLKAGRLFGVPIYIHWTVLALTAFTLADHVDLQEPVLLLWGLLKAVTINVVILCHEFGHVLAGMKNGVRSSRVTLWPLGGLAHLEGRMRSPGMEIEVSIAGPLVNMIFMVASIVPMYLGGHFAFSRDFLQASGLWNALHWFFWMNLMLAAFNLLPMYPLDGGRVFRGIVSLFKPPWKATIWATNLSFLLCALLAAAAIFSPYFDGLGCGMLLMILAFVAINCYQERQMLKYSAEVYDGPGGWERAVAMADVEPARKEEKGFFERRREEREQHRRAKDAAADAKRMERLDQLLDKINAQGIAALTDEEKRFLNEASTKLKKK